MSADRRHGRGIDAVFVLRRVSPAPADPVECGTVRTGCLLRHVDLRPDVKHRVALRLVADHHFGLDCGAIGPVRADDHRGPIAVRVAGGQSPVDPVDVGRSRRGRDNERE